MSSTRWAVSLPGKAGDILWAMPTVRAISKMLGQPLDVYLPAEFKRLAGLLRAQPYVEAVYAVAQEQWPIEMTGPIQPWAMPGAGKEVFHLGHTEWPETILPFQYLLNFERRYGPEFETLSLKGFMDPWIEVPEDLGDFACPSCEGHADFNSPDTIFFGCNQDWIELKMGVLVALLASTNSMTYYQLVDMPGGRHKEFADILCISDEAWFDSGSWLETAHLMKHCGYYVGGLAAQWVLACAMGIPCIVFDPAEGRHHPIFWWDGDGRNKKVLGGDGKPTWDARAVVEAVKQRGR